MRNVQISSDFGIPENRVAPEIAPGKVLLNVKPDEFISEVDEMICILKLVYGSIFFLRHNGFIVLYMSYLGSEG